MNTRLTQSNILKVSAVAIAIPRYAGSFALSAGFIAEGQLHTALGIAEVTAGIAMAILEGFALSYILSRWRLLKPNSLAWWASLIVSSLLALALPMVAIPYLYLMQSSLTSVNEVFNSKLLQNAWNFIVAFAPMLIVIGVGLSDVDELAREGNQADIELELSKKKAEVKLELGRLELQLEHAQAKNELEIKQLRASYKVAVSKVETKVKQGGVECEYCGRTDFTSKRALGGHKAHCKARKAASNGKLPKLEDNTIETEELQDA